LQDDPEDADGGLFVADLDVAPDEEVKELAVGPDFAETKLEEAAGGSIRMVAEAPEWSGRATLDSVIEAMRV